MELQHLKEIESATAHGRGELLRLGVVSLFLVATMLYAATLGSGASLILVVGAALAAYMALNIGANDVANNVGPAVGARAMGLVSALSIAAVCEVAGALLAGGAVVDTVKGSILQRHLLTDGDTVVAVMLCALLAGSIWLNVATALGAPVSTTHSIVGAVLGAGIAARGVEVINWETVVAITTSWVASPLLGAGFAAAFLYAVKRSITYQPDMASAARRVVPYLMAAMTWTSIVFLLVKGLNRALVVELGAAGSFAVIPATLVFLYMRARLRTRGHLIANTKEGVNKLFNPPLVFAAGLLSFAHGSNDVANAVGPLAAILDALGSAGTVRALAGPPLWVLAIGAIGIAVGLALFGPRVIRTIGTEITELDQMRAFCIALAATVTVVLASGIGLPVSSTHIVVGGVFGVGFLREFLKTAYERTVAEIKAHHPAGEQQALDAFLERFGQASVAEKDRLLKDLKARSKNSEDPANFSKSERKKLRKMYKQEVVKRSQLMRIAAAWVVTVPVSGVLAALLYTLLAQGVARA
ncbi:inorganic phosphate transporter [Azoarcus olearius]|uniref:Phosphate transporter n=1 Tax=Azoarcus sp. (strain BH72) TaxID=418699 RepID=A1K7E7_AZOSB|nr:inorganic phosphate transporter [Azoarcus olearius]ANQ85298.1 putative phosphate permease [Azoarcus olearius]CAL94752.1 putative phosphate permease [Azoarcus olearius]